MALIGYARVSSVGQSLDIQLEKLEFCDKVFQEKKAEHRINDLDCKSVWNMSEKGIRLLLRDWIDWHAQPCTYARSQPNYSRSRLT